jgi:hypothetical protein
MSTENTQNVAGYFGFQIDGMSDIEMACKFQKDKWREKRYELFKELDIEFLIGLEKNDEQKKNEVALKKQQLRDVTQTEITETTIAGILDFWPDVFKD